MKFFFSFFIFIFLLSSSVLSIGISPPDIYADYKEGETYEFDIKIINNAAANSYVSLDLYGDLAEYASLSQTEFQFKSNEYFHVVTITATFPDYDDLLFFGKQKIWIYAQEGVPDATGMMGFRTSVKGFFKVDIPVPGKLGVIDSFSVDDTNEGYDAPFTALLRNRGVENLRDASIKIGIFDFAGNEITTQNYNDINIDFDSEYELKGVLSTNTFDSSKYYAELFFTFDPTKASPSKRTSFFVGSTDVELLGYTQNVTAQKINKIRLDLQSLWGSPLKNIRGGVDVLGVAHPLPVLDFEPFENKPLDVFLDIPFTNKTSLPATLTLEIPVDAQTTAKKTFQLTFDVLKDVDPSSESPFGGSSVVLIGVILIVLLLIGVNVVMYIKRKK